MSTKKTIYPLLSPIMGLLPIVVFVILYLFLSYQGALLGALGTFALLFIVDVFVSKNSPAYTAIASAFVFLALITFSIIPPIKYIYNGGASLVLEIFLVLIFSIFYMLRNYFRGKILFKNDPSKDFQLVRFDANFYVLNTAIRLITIHLLIVLVYELLPHSYHTPLNERIFEFYILYTLILFHYIYEYINLFLLQKKIVEEEWLPIVNEQGTVQGKIAKSISEKSGNKYLHPVIRIALVHKGKLYLKQRPNQSITQAERYDHPFESRLKFQETLEDGVKRVFLENGGNEELKARFIFKYVFKNVETNRLIYLYACTVHTEGKLKDLDLTGGRFWTNKQIEENMEKNIFSDYFEKEYELLENTVLLAERLMNKIDDNDDE
ncbi:hypothetical protein LJC06_02120 [Bacteroidales bacterium OttesenSCG-928-I14]|nr:hypothetical protein [Bacteroidales bacterium OttesenSCG-928-I14]